LRSGGRPALRLRSGQARRQPGAEVLAIGRADLDLPADVGGDRCAVAAAEGRFDALPLPIVHEAGGQRAADHLGQPVLGVVGEQGSGDPYRARDDVAGAIAVIDAVIGRSQHSQ